jgi:hypothetical protein
VIVIDDGRFRHRGSRVVEIDDGGITGRGFHDHCPKAECASPAIAQA